MELSERKLKILAAIVNTYVETGEPVGSKLLALELGVSSATIRNEMANLVEMGYLQQPHTSAGRIPSQKGYRIYIDRLMPEAAITEEEQKYLDGMLMVNAYDPDKLLSCVSQLLANTSKFAAVSTMPSGGGAVIKGVQFVQTSRRTAMAILITSTGVMKTRVFRCDFDITAEMLRIFFRIFNEKFAGLPVSAVTPAFIQSQAVSLGEMAVLMSSALLAVLEVARDCMHAEINLKGETNLLFYPEFQLGNVRRIMDFLESEQEVSRFLTKGLEQTEHSAPRISKAQVFIGSETNRPELSDSSLIIAHYSIGGEHAGTIGIIGPTRMHYGKWIAHLEYVSDSVGKMLTSLMKEQ